MAADDTALARHRTRLTALAGVVFAVLVLIVVTRPGIAGTVTGWALLGASAAATAACLWRAAGFTGRARWGWLLIGAGLLLWGLGQFAWFAGPKLYDLLEFPGLAGPAVLVPAGLLTLPSASQPLANRMRSILDGLLIAVSLALVAWVFVIDPRLGPENSGPDFYSKLLFPLADVMLATMVGYMLPAKRWKGGGSADLLFFGTGIGAFVVADAGYVCLVLAGSPADAPIVYLAAVAGFALIALGALRPRLNRCTAGDVPPGVWNTAVLVPYTAVLAALGSSIYFHLATGHSVPIVYYTRSLLILLIVGRQLLTQLENRALTHTLESRVAARTAELHDREQWFHSLIRHSSDVVTVIGADGVITYQSESIQRVFGYGPEVFVGRRYTDLVDAEVALRLAEAMRRVATQAYGTVTLEVVHTHRDGRGHPSEVIITNLVDDPRVAGYVLNTRDISERKELQDQLVHEAYHDSLTQLGNRALFQDRAAAALRAGDDLAVLHLGLDGFKRVNDSLGHLAGDQLLVRVAERLQACVRGQDVVARLGADEFAVLAADAGDAETIARRILDDLEAPVEAGARLIHVRASIGLATTATLLDDLGDTRHGERAEQLMRDADLAMYQAKSAGGGTLTVYHPRMREGLVERLELENDLRGALERGELRLHYQPTIDLATSQVIGFEALVRWPHPVRGMINPLDFIPIAEVTGQIVPLGHWVLHEACRQAVEWSAAADGRPLKMSVNVSVRQLDRADFADSVAQVLAETGMPADRLCLEMTESVLMTDTEANLEQLVRLKALGLTLAIDDFGTGYSSLAYLRRFPVDTLKIDRSFVERLGVIADDTALTDTIVRLGKSLGMSTVAEGIEEFGQLAALREMGCGFAQGYYFSRPIPAAEAGRLFLEGATV